MSRDLQDELWDAINEQEEELAKLRARVAVLEGGRPDTAPSPSAAGDTFQRTKAVAPFRQRVLDVIRESGPMSPTDIVTKFGLTEDTAASSTANACAWLVRHGFVRVSSRANRRVYYVAVERDHG